jgi:nucleotide-binding universal stress UspA family protein
MPPMAEYDRPLLLCFDGSAPAAAAVRAAARLLRPRLAVVASVWRPVDRNGGSSDEPIAERRGGAIARLDEARAERAAALASEGSAIALEAGIAAEPRAIAGDDAATALAREIEASAVVAGGRPAAAHHPRLFASVTRAITHCADCPFLVTHGDQTNARADGPMLLAYDGSDAARHAITASALLLGGAALVVHAWLAPSQMLLWNPRVEGPGPLAEPAAMLDEASAEAAHRLAGEGAEHARAAGYDPEPVTAPIAHGTWRTIVRAARDRHARAIVVGSHGWSPLDAALGTVADRTATHADRPVLMVPSKRTAHDRGS